MQYRVQHFSPKSQNVKSNYPMSFSSSYILTETKTSKVAITLRFKTFILASDSWNHLQCKENFSYRLILFRDLAYHYHCGLAQHEKYFIQFPLIYSFWHVKRWHSSTSQWLLNNFNSVVIILNANNSLCGS